MKWDFEPIFVSAGPYRNCKAKSCRSREREREMRGEETLVEAALRVLNTADPFEKAQLGDSVAAQWLQGSITRPYDLSIDLPVPDRPARLSNVL